MLDYQTTNNQRLGSAGDNDRRSKRFCSNVVIRGREVEGRSARDQIEFCALHTFLVEVKRMLATCIRRMRNNNLPIRIAGSSWTSPAIDHSRNTITYHNTLCLSLQNFV